MMKDSQFVFDFWFSELKPEQWWMKDEKLDSMIRERFLELHQKARQGELFSWRKTPEGRLSEIIILDQFSRNMFRGTKESFATDSLALVLAQEGVSLGEDKKLEIQHRAFFYLPYMHSESPIIHQEAIRLYDQPGLENNLDFELRHKRIVDRFGRYPHRNEILGRVSTPEEIEFLKQPGSSF